MMEPHDGQACYKETQKQRKKKSIYSDHHKTTFKVEQENRNLIKNLQKRNRVVKIKRRIF